MSEQPNPRAPLRASARTVAFVLGVLIVASALLPAALQKMPDFEVYLRAGGRARAVQPLYPASDGHYQLKYLPAFAFFMAPLSFLSLRVAKIVWVYLSVAVAAGFLTAGLDLLPSRRMRAPTLAIVATVVSLKFFLHEWTLGQDNAWMGLLILVGLAAMLGQRPVRAGLAFAGAVVAKPYAVLFLPYLLFRRRWVAFASFAAFLLLALCLPALVYGPPATASLTMGWLRTVRDSTAPNLISQDNVSIWGMYAKWFGAGALATWLALATLAGIGVAILWLCRIGNGLARPEYLEIAALLVLVPLASPQGWDYVLLLALPAVLLLVNYHQDMAPAMRALAALAVFAMGLSIFDVMGRAAYGRFMSLSSITVCALVILSGLASLRLKGVA